MKTIIHVNRHVIAKNKKNGESQPVFTIKRGKKNKYAASVQILGPSKLVYNPEKPLSCGATVWIETYSEVIMESPVDFATMECQS